MDLQNEEHACWRILYVDDEVALRNEIAEELREAGYEVVCLSNGREALSHLRTASRPDLIILDLRMPIMDGWQFRVEQKRDPALSTIPVLAMSADSSPKAAAIDADAYLAKPFDLENLLNAVGDIRRIVERERHRAAHLAQAERMASLGTLAAGVAHEINNPLSYIVANLDFLAAELGEEGSALPADVRSALREAVDETRRGAERVRTIVRDLRTFSRAEAESSGPVDVCRVLDFSIKMAWHEIRHRARLVKNFSEVRPVVANEARLGQIFINLLVNAAHAIDEGRADSNDIRVTARMDSLGRTVVEVADTGKGIAPADRGRIFEPFFTTKPVGVGVGLGLSTCHSLVSAIGGTIEVESEVGKGSTFRVLLPASTRELPVPRGNVASARTGRRGRVLVIDDEPLVGNVLRRSLAKEHDVLAVTDGGDALRRIRNGERFDVIFCDVMMPVITGMEVHAELSKIAPQQLESLIFLTGGVCSARMRAFLDEVPNPRLEKPFDLVNLLAMVRERVR